jgi:hypothetical protein
MSDIYPKAESIIAWIGEEDVSTVSAIVFLDSVAHGKKRWAGTCGHRINNLF